MQELGQYSVNQKTARKLIAFLRQESFTKRPPALSIVRNSVGCLRDCGLKQVPEVSTFIRELMKAIVYFSLVVRGPWFPGSSFVVIKFGMIQNIRLGTSSCAFFTCLSSPASEGYAAGVASGRARKVRNRNR